jgi:hypothetical protein
MISAFQQQGHQAFPLVKLKDNFTNALGDTFHSLLPMVPIHSHTALFDHFQPCHAMPSSSNRLVTNMGRYHFYEKSPNEYSFMDEDLGLTTDESNLVSCCFGCEHSYGKMENIHMRVYGHISFCHCSIHPWKRYSIASNETFTDI